MPKRTLIACILAVFLGIAPYQSPTQAQTSYEFDITSFPVSATAPNGIEDYTAPLYTGGSYQSLALDGSAYKSSFTASTVNLGTSFFLMEYEFDGNVYPEKLTVRVNSSSNNGTCNTNMASFVNVYFLNSSNAVLYPSAGVTATAQVTGVTGSFTDRVFDFSALTATGQSFALNTVKPAKMQVQIGSFCTVGGAPSRTLTVASDAIKLEYTTEYNYFVAPLLADDQININTTDGYTIATATRPFLPVHAPANATVASITPYETQDCLDLGVGVIQCASAIATSGTYTVVLNVGSTPYTYIVADAPTYLDDDTEIIAGCIMGESTQNTGLVITNIDEDDFTLEPDEDAVPCKEAEPPEPNCLNDSLADESSWYKQGAVTWGDEVVLGAGGRIYQIMTLPTNAKSQLTVTAKGGLIEIRLGNTVQAVDLSPDYNTISTPSEIHTPNLVDFWEISIRNTGDDDVTVSDVCIEIEELGGGGTGPSGNCYFENHNFSDGLDKWAITGNVTDGTGMALIARGAGIAQLVVMQDKEYVLELEIGLWYADDFDISANASTPISVSYVFPLDEPPIYVDFPTFTIGDIGDDQNYTISVSITPDSEALEGDFYIEIDAPALSGLSGVSITRACLRPADGDWGDNPPPDDGTPFSEYCEVISPPRGNDISRWITWHWHNLSQFFECDLMVTLNNTYGLLRWFQAMSMLFFNWLGDMGTWINGHVQNLIFAIANSDKLREWQMPNNVPSGDFGISGLSGIQSFGLSQIQSGEDCNWYDVFCHGRNIVGGVIDFAGGVINDVVGVLVNFIGALLAQIVDLITWGYRQFIEPITQLWNDFWSIVGKVKDTIALIFEGENNFVAMWNDTEPVPPPGLQDCSESPEIKTLCLVYWVAENTLLEGTWGNLIIPLLTSILGIFGLILILRNFTQLVESARNA